MINGSPKLRQTPRQSGGFTLIELLVVVAVIALLIGILLPALGQARRSAQKAQGANIQRQLVIGMITYSNSNNNEVPGMNTSAKNYDGSTSTDDLSEDSELPITMYDWMSPALDADDTPESWAERAYYLFDRFQDPSMTEVLQSSQVTSPDSNLGTLIDDNGGMPTSSYLMPMSWQTAGADLGSSGLITQVSQEADVFEVPATYRPRLDQFGGSARKVALADGVPGVNSPSLSLDLTIYNDGSNIPNTNGFVALPPCVPPLGGGDAYDPDADLNRLSYRQPGNTMNITRWDGSGSELNEQQSKDPSLWYPPQTLYLGNAQPEVETDYGYESGDYIN
ncbi:MAG: type II secretion system protein [Phycisphaerales bacterium JB065]